MSILNSVFPYMVDLMISEWLTFCLCHLAYLYSDKY
jgi:hypothetical protein